MKVTVLTDNLVNEAIQAYPDRKIKAMIGGFHLFNKSDGHTQGRAGRYRPQLQNGTSV